MNYLQSKHDCMTALLKDSYCALANRDYFYMQEETGPAVAGSVSISRLKSMSAKACSVHRMLRSFVFKKSGNHAN
eukprot:240330-Pelagomonas_calceolata.AAC.9